MKEEVIGLYFVKRNNDCMEYIKVFLFERFMESTNDSCKVVQEFSCTIEFGFFVNEY